MRPIAIAIDGPASSGKGTVARLLARALDFAYVDTGAMYRAVALFALERGCALSDGPALGDLAQGLDFRFGWDRERLRIFVNDREVTDAIRAERVGQGASDVAVHPAVRAALLGRQRELAARGGVVMDGRDIGTVVLPDAALKIFLDAKPAERARRRAAELRARGIEVDEAVVQAEIEARDLQDRSRATAPLRAADDAIVLDSTGETALQVASRIEALARSRFP